MKDISTPQKKWPVIGEGLSRGKVDSNIEQAQRMKMTIALSDLKRDPNSSFSPFKSRTSSLEASDMASGVGITLEFDSDILMACGEREKGRNDNRRPARGGGKLEARRLF